MRAAAAPTAPPRASAVAALTESERRAFHRWIVGVWFSRWLDGLAYPSGLCGGDLPPCYVMERESGGDIRAENPVSTASGKWQALDTSWNGWGGYAHASWAPEKVQDDFARWLWDGGRGCTHWSACG